MNVMRARESAREKNINPKHKKKARNETNCIYSSDFRFPPSRVDSQDSRKKRYAFL